MSQHSTFLDKAKERVGDESHRKRLLKVVDSYDSQVRDTKNMQFLDWEEARTLAAAIKDYALENLPTLLKEFEEKITARGAKVLWAKDAEEARKYFLEIVERHSAKLVVKSKSMTTEEVELNELLERKKIEVVESDLGEFIQQLAHEKPYHIVTPAMHQTKAGIAQIFQKALGTPLSDDAEELAMICRDKLREVYLKAEIGVSGANFILADQGAISITENEGNARLTTSCPPVHVAFAGIEKVLPRMSDLELFLPLLATSGTGQQITGYNSIIRGPKLPGEEDGPEHFYVILLDNGRSDLFAKEHFRQSLRCIRCGACLSTCPVFKTVGGHTYNTTYQGPIGSVITPHLKNFHDWQHLSQASSLCGACSDVCPVHIDLHHLLLENRALAYEENHTAGFWKMALKQWAWVATRRRAMDGLRPLSRVLSKMARPFVPQGLKSKIPNLPEKSFSQLWKERQQ